MVRYRRNFVPGGFTVTLADRTSSALVHNVAALREAFRIACQARCAASRLGGRCRRTHDGFRRAAGLTPDFASLHPGYG